MDKMKMSKGDKFKLKADKIIKDDLEDFDGDDFQPAEKSSKKGKVKEVKKADTKKKSRKNKQISFATYIHRVLKQVHRKIGITKQAMTVMNDLVTHAFYQIAEEAGKLVKSQNRETLTPRDIDSAVRLILPGELAAHSVTEGGQALHSFQSTSAK